MSSMILQLDTDVANFHLSSQDLMSRHYMIVHFIFGDPINLEALK